jgi:hypothetical protein
LLKKRKRMLFKWRRKEIRAGPREGLARERVSNGSKSGSMKVNFQKV